jgi:alkylhydroperoxidase family enzyme
MGHAPHVLTAWSSLEEVFFKHSLLPSDLLEQVRRTLASSHGCQYCQAKGGPPDDRHTSLRTSLAVGIAQQFSQDHRSIDESMLKVAREHFSDAEIVELIAFMGFMWAGGTFGKILGIKPSEIGGTESAA